MRTLRRSLFLTTRTFTTHQTSLRHQGEAGVDGHRSGGRSGDGAALTDRVTAQAQPSAGSVGSGDVTDADTAAAATTGGVTVAEDDAVTGGGITSGPAVQAPPATPTATAARGDGDGDGGDAM
ncbi:hypothetical protein PLESTB_000709800 [Pleodorina starrii]|uniref:Uncharacterized protein n=1 Tax=Pleodorina starrii TaxID=330485 RepID=A0A9W6B9J1_9CHLO|nr:hypothetical protein PLESTB_000054100 [Pleodorina starrii]GLC53119.1 hypothetical protein PLESTB_000709800 [Pleodorina starrii]GLC76996.1 hypothetical protein PLESTF_001871900 [Pleodorina starrii]